MTDISEVKIVKLAFNMLGHESQITTIGENGRDGKLSLRHFGHARDLVLSEGDWNFATRRKTLSRDAVKPPFGFLHYYLLPADFDRELVMYNSKANYKIEATDQGTRLATDETIVNLIYISLNEDVTQWPPLVREAIVQRLAMSMCMTITKDVALYNRLEISYERAKKKAWKMDQRSGTPRRIDSQGFTGYKVSNIDRLRPNPSY